MGVEWKGGSKERIYIYIHTYVYKYICIYIFIAMTDPLLSQFIPPTPFPTGFTSVFSMSMSSFFPPNRSISTIFLDSTYML